MRPRCKADVTMNTRCESSIIFEPTKQFKPAVNQNAHIIYLYVALTEPKRSRPT